MTNPNIVVVNSVVQQTSADAGDYKTQIILDTNFNTLSRVTTYAVGGYSEVKSGSPLRKALDSAFSVSGRKPAIVKVGRSKGTAIYVPSGVAATNTYGFSLTVSNAGTLSTQVESYVTGVAETAEDVVTALKDQFDLVTAITDVVTLTVVGTGASAALHIELNDANDDFKLTAFTGEYTLSSTDVEAVVDTIDAILDIDEDWSWVTSTNHTPAYQAALAAAVQVLEYKKYQTSSQLEENYLPWDGVSIPSANDVVGTMTYNEYNRTNVFYHHDSDNLYPEMQRISLFAEPEPGRSNFQYKPLVGVGLAMIADGSRKLNTQELLKLKQCYATTTVIDGKQVFVGGYDGQGNRMADGTRIEAVYWTDRTAQKIKQIVLNYFLNRNKVGMNDNDISAIVGAIATYLDSQVSAIGATFALNPIRPYKIEYPKAKDISFEDQVAGLLQNLKITAYSDASMDKVIADLTVTFYDPALES